MNKTIDALIEENEMLKKRLDLMRYIATENQNQDDFFKDPRLKAVGESEHDYKKFYFTYRRGEWRQIFRAGADQGCGITQDGVVRVWNNGMYGIHDLKIEDAKKIVCVYRTDNMNFAVCLTRSGNAVCINYNDDGLEHSRFSVEGSFTDVCVASTHAILMKSDGSVVIVNDSIVLPVNNVKYFVKNRADRQFGHTDRIYYAHILTDDKKLYVLYHGLKSYCSVDRFVSLHGGDVMGVNDYGKVFTTDRHIQEIPKSLQLTSKQYLYVAKHFDWINSSHFPSSIRNTEEYREIRKTQKAKSLLSKLSDYE